MMTKIEILRKVVEKAEENKTNTKCFSSWFDYYNEVDITCNQHFKIIFSQDFAKAFWGNKICKNLCPCNLEYMVGKFTYEYNEEYDNNVHRRYGQPMMDWEYHLQQIVLEKEPLKYLEKFL